MNPLPVRSDLDSCAVGELRARCPLGPCILARLSVSQFSDNCRCTGDTFEVSISETPARRYAGCQPSFFPGPSMPPTDRPRLSLGDVMILVATTGLSLSIYILLDNGLFRGQRFFFGLLQPSAGFNTLQMISRVGGALSILLILFGGWTLVLPVLPLRKHRPQWRRLGRQPGISACIAVATGMLIWAVVASVTFWLRDQVEGHPGLPPAFWIRSPVFDGLIPTPVILCATCERKPANPAYSGRGERTFQVDSVLLSALACQWPLSGPSRSSQGAGDRTPTGSTGSAAASASSGSRSGRPSPRVCACTDGFRAGRRDRLQRDAQCSSTNSASKGQCDGLYERRQRLLHQHASRDLRDHRGV
jgi:hypothetical protein